MLFRRHKSEPEHEPIVEDEDDYDEDYDDDDGDVGCDACGNPAYPYCKSSCPLFDD